MSLRLDGYIRVSRVGGRVGEGYIAPQVQRGAIEGYAQELGGKIIDWHNDEDQSGGTVNRPGFQAVLERLRSGQADGVVVMRIDRFARSVADGAAIVREITDNGQVFASCHERIDPRTPEGKYMLNSFLNNAELFLNQSKASWWTAKAKAIARGAHIGPTPVGYLKVDPTPTKPTHISPEESEAMGGPTGKGMLVPSASRGPFITELFQRAAAGTFDDTALARWMTSVSPRDGGGAAWQSSEVRRWLRQRVYLGEVHYGDDLSNTDAHEPLTDQETWERCQRPSGQQRRSPDAAFLLTGLLRCASCRYSMGGFSHGGSKQDTPVYRCGRSSKGCPESSLITAKPLEDHLRDLVLDRVRGLQLEAAGAGLDLEAVDRAYHEAEQELRAFAEDVTARQRLGDATWQEALTARADHRDKVRAARDEAYAQSRLVDVARDVDDLEHEGLRDLLLGMVKHVFIRRQPRGSKVADRVLVIWSDDTRLIEVPGPHRSGPFEPIRW